MKDLKDIAIIVGMLALAGASIQAFMLQRRLLKNTFLFPPEAAGAEPSLFGGVGDFLGEMLG